MRSFAERPLRFGAICPGAEVDAAFAAAIRELLGVDGVELAAVIVDPDRASPSTRRSGGALWDAYLRLLPLNRIPCYRPVDLSGAFAGVPRIEPPLDMEEIRRHELDFVLCFDARAAGGEMLDVPTYGVWAFHHGGFWEIHSGDRATEASLQRVTGPSGAGLVLQQCFISTNPASHRATVDAVTWGSSYMPARVAKDIVGGLPHPLDSEPGGTGAPLREAPTNAETARFLGRMALARLRAHLRSIFLLERWHVGIVRHPIESFLGEGFDPAVEWLPHRPRRGFLADPFLAGTGTASRLLMEEWHDGSQRGDIVEVDLDRGMRGLVPSPALDAPTHMAYPYVFEHAGRLYCTPENHQRRGVFLYVLDPEGGRWEEHSQLLEDVAAVDPTVIHREGRWWLFCTDEDDDPHGKLLLWSAPDLLGPWEPHPGNPVKADIRSSRPAGTPFVVDGELYRPAQDSAGGYGRAVTINRVTRLTTTEFAEEPVARFGPWPGSPYRAGAHTLAGWGELTAVDGKQMAFAPHLVARRIVRKLGRLAVKLTPALRHRSSASSAPTGRR